MGEHTRNIQNDEQVKNITQINVDLNPRKITMMNENIPRKNDIHKNKSISQTNLDNRTWKIVLQNTRGLITENSNKKLKMIEEYTNEEKIFAFSSIVLSSHVSVKFIANIFSSFVYSSTIFSFLFEFSVISPRAH